jgi:hypothetical protein
MKIGLGLISMGVLAFAVGHGCGGGATGTKLDMCLNQGKWTGTGSCGVTSFDISSSSSGSVVTLTDFGENASVDFAADSDRFKLTADGLVILAAPNHTCTITCKASDTIALHCTNASGGKCDSTFQPEASAAP